MHRPDTHLRIGQEADVTDCGRNVSYGPSHETRNVHDNAVLANWGRCRAWSRKDV